MEYITLVSIIQQKKNKFELYTNNFDEFSFVKLKDVVEEILDFSNITHKNLQDERIAPRKTSTFKKLETQKTQTDGCYMLLMGYAWSPFRDFGSYLRNIVGLDEDDIQLIFEKKLSHMT